MLVRLSLDEPNSVIIVTIVIGIIIEYHTQRASTSAY